MNETEATTREYMKQKQQKYTQRLRSNTQISSDILTTLNGKELNLRKLRDEISNAAKL